MKHYEILYAEDVPHYGCVLIEADSPDDAVRIARDYDYAYLVNEPEWCSAACKRIVSIHDETGEIIAGDISLDECFLRCGGEPDELRCNAAEAMLETLHSALEWIETGRVDGVGVLAAQLRDDIRAVIAKAEGKAAQ